MGIPTSLQKKKKEKLGSHATIKINTHFKTPIESCQRDGEGTLRAKVYEKGPFRHFIDDDDQMIPTEKRKRFEAEAEQHGDTQQDADIKIDKQKEILASTSFCQRFWHLLAVFTPPTLS